MRLAFFSAALLLGLVPGLPGALEDAAHLIAEGHTLHQDHHDADVATDHGEEHEPGEDCEDCGHDGFCHCHGGSSLAAAPVRVGLDADATARVLEAPALAAHRPRAPVSGLERPPRS